MAQLRGRMASVPTSAPSCLIGRRCRIVGLAAHPEWNGLAGTAVRWDAETERYAVKVDGQRGKWALRPANLELESAAAQPLPPQIFDALPCTAAELDGLVGLDLAYPGLVCVHKDPFIFMIADFLPPDACDEICRRAATDLHSSLMDGKRSARLRTSRSTHFNPDELPCVVDRLRALAPPSSRLLYSQRVLHYSRGEYIGRHTDLLNAHLYDGTRCKAPEEFASGRSTQVMTRLFCYLNDCAEGGCTHFFETSLPPLVPRRGAACVFMQVRDLHAQRVLPCVPGLPRPARSIPDDPRPSGQAHTGTFDAAPCLRHEALPAIDEKYLLDTGWCSATHALVPHARCSLFMRRVQRLWPHRHVTQCPSVEQVLSGFWLYRRYFRDSSPLS